MSLLLKASQRNWLTVHCLSQTDWLVYYLIQYAAIALAFLCIKICILWWNFVFYHDIAFRTIMWDEGVSSMRLVGNADAGPVFDNLSVWNRWEFLDLLVLLLFGYRLHKDSWNPDKSAALSYIQTLSVQIIIYVKKWVALLHWYQNEEPMAQTSPFKSKSWKAKLPLTSLSFWK